MSGLRPYEGLLAIVETAAAGGLLVRFLCTGLQKTYQFFSIYLAVVCIQGIYPFFVSVRRNAYGWIFIAIEAVIICLYALIVLELYSLVLRGLPGIASTARRYIRIAVAIAILLSLLILSLEQLPDTIHARQQRYLSQFFSFERPVVSSLVLFVLLITAFLVYYPVPLHRNVIYYTIGYFIYFTSKAVALFLRNTGHQWDNVLSPALLAVSTACLIFWIFALTRQGEEKTMVIGRAPSRDEEQRLLQKLNALNATLLRARK